MAWLRQYIRKLTDVNRLRRQVKELKASLDARAAECSEQRRLRDEFSDHASELSERLKDAELRIERLESEKTIQEMEVAALTKFHELTMLRMSSEVTRITEPVHNPHREFAE